MTYAITSEPTLRFQVQRKYAKELPGYSNNWDLIWSFDTQDDAVACVRDEADDFYITRIVDRETDEILAQRFPTREAA